jgi:hypothetical protein
LVEAGLLERRRYSEHPPRDDYVPTARGRDFRPVLIALMAWGNRHFAPEGASVQLVNIKTGEAVEPIMVDPATGTPISETQYALTPGPAAPERTRHRYERHSPSTGGATSTEVATRAKRTRAQPKRTRS